MGTREVPAAAAWRMWEDNSDTTDAWKEVWGLDSGPRGRTGHSMVLHNNDTVVVLFGGRDNEIQREHVPKTYEIERVNGSLEFVAYNDKPVLTCQANALADGTASNDTCALDVVRKRCHDPAGHGLTVRRPLSGLVTVGLYYNDVWVYDLNCSRRADAPCPDGSGWRVLHPGSRQGGCEYDDSGNSVCTTPGERWGHGAAMFDDGTMLVYGGYSQLCSDYCDDLWLFDLANASWMQILAVGSAADADGADSPGKRWRFSVVADGYRMLLFGGHRLWHGFATDNSEDNDWASTAQFPAGGYLGDFWEYRKAAVAAGEAISANGTGIGNFSRIEPLELCYANPGRAWSDRNDVTCALLWPRARAGHAAVWDSDRGGMWMHGGYSTYFPYLSTDGAGSGNGTASSGSGDGFKPYADYPFFLNDLWFFDGATGFWTEITPASSSVPAARMDHVLLKVNALVK
ncbi:unnamed protein product [Phaeothamnion confervicola]